MKTQNFIIGGKLGDFLHSMFAVKSICRQNGTKANVYLIDFGFSFGGENTRLELYDILMQQDYMNSFELLKECEVDPIQNPHQNSPVRVFNQKLLDEGYVALTGYIASPWLYKACWSDLYSFTFDFKIPNDYSWISYDKINPELKGKVLIHRKDEEWRVNRSFPHDAIIEKYKGNVMFISSSQADYDAFRRPDIPFLKVTTLEEWFTSINSCLMLVSNLSSPAAMAHSLDKLRIIESPYILDANHFIGEEKYSNNFYWYINEDLCYDKKPFLSLRK